jgi:selenocysteine lyase/cysteine desulfurase
MAYDVARVRGLHPSLGDGWVHFDAPSGMLIPDSVATTVSTAFRGSFPSTTGPHPAAKRSAAVLEAARQAAADLVNADPRGVVLVIVSRRIVDPCRPGLRDGRHPP